MTTPSPSVVRSALALMSVRRVAMQIGLALLVFALALVWLRIPDANAIDVIGSAMLGLVIITLADIGQASILLRFCDRRLTFQRLLRSALLLLIGAALWCGWCALLAHMHGEDFERAGYLNSRFPHGMRHFFTFEHIVLWFGWMWTALEWIGAGVIALFAFTATTSTSPIRAMSRAACSITYWIALLLGTSFATMVTGSLVQWTPGHGLSIEMLSLVLRLCTAVLVDATVATFLLAILAVCVLRSDALYDTPAGTPDESQPRTAEKL